MMVNHEENLHVAGQATMIVIMSYGSLESGVLLIIGICNELSMTFCLLPLSGFLLEGLHTTMVLPHVV